MHSTFTKADLSKLLAKIAETLDIPDHFYEDAVLKYEDVGTWLAAEDSKLHDFKPEIYAQGSFRLGTVVKPLSITDDYDIDLVCHLQINKEEIAQKTLKDAVGKRLKERDDLAKKLKESRRCWSLDFPKQFHMDVLPAIPNIDKPPTGILLTDTELARWQKSNPLAYVEWFNSRITVVFQEMRKAMAESFQASIDEVPEWRVKTPLQRVIQLLKRHRDIHFQKNKENKPVSIIITTLAAHAYQNQHDLYDALLNISSDMRKHIEYRKDKWWVTNPVDPDENFADKWNEKPELMKAFYSWLDKVQQDIKSLLIKKDLREASESISKSLGESAVSKAASSLGIAFDTTVPAIITESVRVPALADSSHCQPPQWPQQIVYKASIKGSVRRYKYDEKKLWVLADRPVPKNIWLRFSVKTNVPEPYEVKWQVVNTGKEAGEAGELRGDFYDGNSNLNGVRWEHTKFLGTHWVEAFIIKNKSCVARTGKKLVKVR